MHLRHIIRTLSEGIIVAIVLALAALTLSSSTAEASPALDRQARTYYGAISISYDGAIGYAYDYRTRANAQNAAQRRCRQHSRYPGQCRTVGWVRNDCGAVSVKYRPDRTVSEYKFGYGPSKAIAERQARRNFGGRIRGYVCTTR